MDPYLERPEIWPDFHDRLITYIADAIQPLVMPNYAALTQDRLYVVAHDHAIYPDVSVVEVNPNADNGGQAVATQADRPLVVEAVREEFREPYLQIIEPAAGNRVVTAIEVLSPANKRPGKGRDSYLAKRDELWDAEANVVEIDLLRDGEPTVRTAQPNEAGQTPPYAVVVSRSYPTRYERYAFTVRDRLPRVSLPLAYGDADVLLDLPAVFARCYESGPYAVLLDRKVVPPGVMSEGDRDWCRTLVPTS
jgi:hypothetical protein